MMGSKRNKAAVVAVTVHQDKRAGRLLNTVQQMQFFCTKREVVAETGRGGNLG